METPNTTRSVGRQPVFTEATALDVLEFYRTLGSPVGLKAFCQQAYEQFLTPRIISPATVRKLLQGKLFPELKYPSGALFDYAAISKLRMVGGRTRTYPDQFDIGAAKRRVRQDIKESLPRLVRDAVATYLRQELAQLVRDELTKQRVEALT